MKSQEQFKAGKNDISWVGSNFSEHLYGIDFEKASAKGLMTRTLQRDMNDAAIAKEFGPAPVLLGDVLAFLKTASHADWYIFYVNDAEGTLWAVLADWDSGGGWDVGARSVTRPGDWGAGFQVLSRRFSDASEKDTQALRTSDPCDCSARLEAVEAILKHHKLTSPDVS